MSLRRWMTFSGAGLVSVLALLWSTRWEMQAATQDVDWEALNPAFAGATFVRDAQTCAMCHEEAISAFGETRHAHEFRLGKTPPDGECESCHGPRSKHVENPDRQLEWASYGADGQSTVCLQCHEGGDRMGWKAGEHSSSDVSCTSCHYVMAEHSEQNLLVRPVVDRSHERTP